MYPSLQRVNHCVNFLVKFLKAAKTVFQHPCPNKSVEILDFNYQSESLVFNIPYKYKLICILRKYPGKFVFLKFHSGSINLVFLQSYDDSKTMNRMKSSLLDYMEGEEILHNIMRPKSHPWERMWSLKYLE